MAVAHTNVACTISGATMPGSRWRTTIIGREVPADLWQPDELAYEDIQEARLVKLPLAVETDLRKEYDGKP